MHVSCYRPIRECLSAGHTVSHPSEAFTLFKKKEPGKQTQANDYTRIDMNTMCIAYQ